MSEAEHTILAGLLQQPSRMADVGSLTGDFFTDAEVRKLFLFAQGYHRKREGRNALDLQLARSLLERRGSSEGVVNLLALVEEYSDSERVSAPEFREALTQVQGDRQKLLIREHGAAAVEAIVADDYTGAKQQFRAGLLAVEDADLEDDQPSDLHSKEQVEAELRALDAASTPLAAGFDVGFPRLTQRVSFRQTELTILGGYAGDGKTQFAKTLAYNANTLSGANVLFVAMEMERREMRVLFTCQHAVTIDPRGVDYRSILDGTASASDKKLYREALKDFEWGSHEDTDEGATPWGKLLVWSPRKTITMNDYCDRVLAINEDLDNNLHIAVPDYFELIEPSKDFKQYRLNLYHMAKQAKALARQSETWQLVPHQIGRSGRDAAEKREGNYYLMRDLGESSGIEKAADSILWVYSDEVMKDDRTARVGIAKARKGRTMIEGMTVMADYTRAIMGPVEWL